MVQPVTPAVFPTFTRKHLDILRLERGCVKKKKEKRIGGGGVTAWVDLSRQFKKKKRVNEVEKEGKMQDGFNW